MSTSAVGVKIPNSKNVQEHHGHDFILTAARGAHLSSPQPSDHKEVLPNRPNVAFDDEHRTPKKKNSPGQILVPDSTPRPVRKQTSTTYNNRDSSPGLDSVTEQESSPFESKLFKALVRAYVLLLFSP